MTYQIDIFKHLAQQFPTWETLEAYLVSPEGGTLRCVGEGRYRILRYTKGVSDLTVPHGKWMRSVVWDTQTNLPVCVAPPKAETGPVPTGEDSSYPLVQDFLDGSMINVFRIHDDISPLQIATRTQVGAGGKFYSEKTFEQLFNEALSAMKSSSEELMSHLEPGQFASFVLQHPEHRIVSRCTNPRLWLVHVGTVLKDGTVGIEEDPQGWGPRFRIPVHTTPSFPDLCVSKGWFFQGLTYKDGKGKRWRVRNPNYLTLRSLRGSESTAMDRFLRLRSEGKVADYLKHYSEDRQSFWDFEQALRAKTQEVFAAYCSVHKSREQKFEDLPWSVKPCVFKLHSHYLEHLRPNTEKIYMKHAVDIVNTLAIYEQKRLLTCASGHASGHASTGSLAFPAPEVS